MLPNLIQNYAAEHKNMSFQAKKLNRLSIQAREVSLSTRSKFLHRLLLIVQTATTHTNRHPEFLNWMIQINLLNEIFEPSWRSPDNLTKGTHRIPNRRRRNLLVSLHLASNGTRNLEKWHSLSTICGKPVVDPGYVLSKGLEKDRQKHCQMVVS